MADTDKPDPMRRSMIVVGREAIRQLPRWKKAMLVGSIAFFGVGLVLFAFEARAQEQTQVAQDPGGSSPNATTTPDTVIPPGSVRPSHQNPPGGAGLLPDGTTPPAGDETGATGSQGPPDDADGGWSPMFLKMGFSFFVGFTVGMAMRVFVRVLLVFSGFFFLAMFGLSYAELITVEWHSMNDMFDRLIDGAPAQFEGFKTFMTGSLPAAGMGVFGLVAGLRKK